MSYLSSSPGSFSAQGGVSNFFKGADVASGSTIVPTGNQFVVTGTATITAITATGLNAGTDITLVFAAAATVQHGASLVLTGGVNFVATAGDVLTLTYDGLIWREKSRSNNLTRGASDFNSFTAKATPVAADLLLIEDSAAANAKKKSTLAQLLAAGLNATEATATGTINTSSTTDVVATSMTITPAAGTYLVLFAATVSSDANSGLVYTSIWAAGGQVAASELSGNPKNSPDRHAHTNIAKVTVNGAQAIEGRWRVGSGTGSMYQRTLEIVKVA